MEGIETAEYYLADRGDGFTKVANGVMRAQLSHGAFHLYCVLCSFDYHSKGTKKSKRRVWPNFKTLQKLMGHRVGSDKIAKSSKGKKKWIATGWQDCSASTLTRLVRELKDAGLIDPVYHHGPVAEDDPLKKHWTPTYHLKG